MSKNSSTEYEAIHVFPDGFNIPIKDIYKARRDRVRYSGYSSMMLEEIHKTEIGPYQMYQRGFLQNLSILVDNVLNEHELKFNAEEKKFLHRYIHQGIMLFNFNWTHNIDGKLGLQFARVSDKILGPVFACADKRSGYKMRDRIKSDRKYNPESFKWSRNVGTHNGCTLKFYTEEEHKKRKMKANHTTPTPKSSKNV